MDLDMKKLVLGIAAAGAAGAAAYVAIALIGQPDAPATAPITQVTPLVSVVIPAAFTDQQIMGQRAFDANCAACHGTNAAGLDGLAPPLVHKIYEPSHHPDEAFQRAVARGVQSHHWPFGNMPPIDGLTRADVEAIVSYVRALQVENGIN